MAERRSLLRASHEAICVWVSFLSVGIGERLKMNTEQLTSL